MRKLFIFVFITLSGVTIHGQDLPTDRFFYRTLNIAYNDQTATGFVVDSKGQKFIVTAKHLFKGDSKNVLILVKSDTTWLKISGTVFFHTNKLIDIAVIKPVNLHVPDGIPLTQSALALGDAGFFLGFPFGMTTKTDLNGGFPFPLIKRATFSGNSFENGVEVYFLDGHNNPGFSGGPVLFNDRTPNGHKGLQLVGVVSGYVNQKNQMVTPIGNFDYFENSGIVVAIGSNHISEIINGIK